MNCHRCGNTLPTNATGCPQCDGAPSHTKKLSQTDLNKTRALVQLERCANCGWMVYPNDDECSACGAWINRPWKPGGAKKQTRSRSRNEAKSGVLDESENQRAGGMSVWIGVAISVAVLCLIVIAWHYMFRSNLQ